MTLLKFRCMLPFFQTHIKFSQKIFHCKTKEHPLFQVSHQRHTLGSTNAAKNVETSSELALRATLGTFFLRILQVGVFFA